MGGWVDRWGQDGSRDRPDMEAGDDVVMINMMTTRPFQ